MKFKKWTALCITAMLLVGLVGCGGEQNTGGGNAGDSTQVTDEGSQDNGNNDQQDTQTGSGGTADAADLKIAVMVPGSETDGGFCQLGAEACRYVGEQYGVDVTVIEAETADVMKAEAEDLALEGYHIIFGHGGQYATPFEEISDDYPDTYFVTMGGAVVKDNQIPIIMDFEQSVYVAGVMAGMLTETNKLGTVIGADFPAYSKTSNAFKLGAESVNPDVEVMHAALSNIDMNEAYETTMSQIQSGADFVFANANQGTLGAIKAANETGTYTFGALADYAPEAPEVCVASGICDYSMAYLAFVDYYLADEVKPETMFLGMKEGAIRFVWNEDLKGSLPQEVQDIPQVIIDQIISGEIHVPNEYEQ